MQMAEAFRGAIQKILFGVRDERARRILVLAAVGQPGAYGHELIETFRQLGIVHLLVLSGAQARHYLRSLRALAALTFRTLGLRNDLAAGLVKGLVVAGSYVYGSATHWPAPLTRALLLGLLLWYGPRLQKLWLWALAMALELWLFPQHLGALSFYLSWFCFIWADFFSGFRWPRWLAGAALTLICQMGVLYMKGREPPPLHIWPLWVAANLAFGFLFQTLLSPLLGGLLALVFLLLLLPAFVGREILPGLGSIFGMGLNASAAVILVAVKAFMYTHLYDL